MNENIIKILDTYLIYYCAPKTSEKSLNNETEISKIDKVISTIAVELQDNKKKVSDIIVKMNSNESKFYSIEEAICIINKRIKEKERRKTENENNSKYKK